MAGAAISRSVPCPHCGRPVDTTKLQERSAGLLCDACDASIHAARQRSDARQCPACSARVAAQEESCAGCGFDYRLGYSPKAIAAQTAFNASRRLCPNCSRDCTGMNDVLRCPDCSAWLEVGRPRTTQATEEEKPVAQRLWSLVAWPLITLSVSLAVFVVYMRLTGQSDAVAWAFGRMGARAAILMFTVWTATLIWVELDRSWARTALDLFVIACVGYVAEQILWDGTGMFLAYPFATLVFVGLFMSRLDLELNDAILLTMYYWLTMFLVLYIIVIAMR